MQKVQETIVKTNMAIVCNKNYLPFSSESENFTFMPLSIWFNIQGKGIYRPLNISVKLAECECVRENINREREREK